MKKHSGGMVFRSGKPIRLTAPPTHVAAQPIRLECHSPPNVTAGQSVLAGQMLAPPHEQQNRVTCVSPITGTVSKIDPIENCGQTTEQPNRYAICIQPTEERIPAWWPAQPPNRKLEDWLQAVTSLGNLVGPNGFLSQLKAAQATPPDTLICVGLDTFPPYPVRSSLLRSFPDDAVLGTLALADLLQIKNVSMLASRHTRVLSRLRPSSRNFKLKLISCDDVYPNANPTLIVSRYTPNRRRLPVASNPVTEARTMLISPWTAIRIARWHTLEHLTLARPMMIGWTMRHTAMTHAYAIPGQPIASLDPLLETALRQGYRVILGNPMTNEPVPPPNNAISLSKAPVIPQQGMLVTVLNATPGPIAEPCISCGWCVEACPMGLRPNRMMELATKSRLSTRNQNFLDSQLQWCIDCGLCSHTCPSSLPLAQTFRKFNAEKTQGST